ncbi:DUF3223 domain-containing protein [Pontibacter virosus]|uniref:DUF3223 domain-containing protein n=1 Tax=Pontibacter virosus TaxID=1765052 RepID=A0A2U1B2S3_9BACT|nr:DUF3223 domain-containing protein [Pontibacter virosus]PVY42979.1 hypothetical protein C8E01_102155 [Pontibacter virosus]
MRKSLRIGKREFKFKKDAIAHYRSILNSYEFGQYLNDTDLEDLIELMNYDYINYLAGSENIEGTELDKEGAEVSNTIPEDQTSIFIEDIVVAKVQFSTKCFEVNYSDGTSQYISYLMMVNNEPYNPEKLFYTACRNAVHTDIRAVKQAYFDKYSVKGQVKCQETGVLSKWTELVVDHRQPNTFSIIVDRFKEVNKFDFNAIEYVANNENHLVFEEQALVDKFRYYHKEKAVLRVVRKECNSSRTGMARLKKSSKDLTIE